MAADKETIDRLGLEIHEFPLEGVSTPEDDDNDVHQTVKRLLTEARSHYEEELEPEQAEATDFYMGRPFGGEREGRSQVVSTDVRDVTLGQLPDLMRIITGPDRILEFVPTRGKGALADQQTEYMNHVMYVDNSGFNIIYGWLKDALVRKIGVVKWWWEESEQVVDDVMLGLSQPQLIRLATDSSIEDFQILEVRNVEGVEVFDVVIQRRQVISRARFEGVPNNEFWFTPDARSLRKSQVVAHSREVPIDEVIGLGYERADIEDYIGKAKRTGSEDLESSRQFHGGGAGVHNRDGGERDKSREVIVFTEAYAWIDTDGDDLAELRRFDCVGPDFHVLNDDGEAVDRVPFSIFTPDPEPHTVVGLCNFDLLKDIQKIKSQIQRGMLDSLAQSIDNQMEVVAGEVNMKDLLNPEVSNIVRVRRPGMLREIKHTFAGAETISALTYMDEVRTDRTGKTRGSEGLDPDSLQSSTQEAVVATLQGSQQRVYLLARVFAETALKDLVRGLHDLTIKHQDQARVIRMRGQWVDIDPRYWESGLDLRVNVALGMGTPAERIAVYSNILAKQEAYIQSGVPFVDFTHMRYTLDKLVRAANLPCDASEFFGEWTPQQQQMYDKAKAENPPKDPAQEIVETEQMKLQLDSVNKKNELELKRLEIHMEDDRERDKQRQDAALKELEIETRYMTALLDAQTKKQVAASKPAPTSK
jgi:hypothetical protein